MKNHTRRRFLRDAATILLLPVTASITSATLEDLLEKNDAHAQETMPPQEEVQERLSFTISLRDYETHSILGRIDRANVGQASFHVRHTQDAYRISINSSIDVLGSWVRMQARLSGAFLHDGGYPQFRPRRYWLSYREGGEGLTQKEFMATIYFDFSTYTSRAYGYHEEEGEQTRRYGSRSAPVESRFDPSTRDLISAMMEARFLPAQRRRQMNTIVEGRPQTSWLEYEGLSQFQPRGTSGYPTRFFQLHFPNGLLGTPWDLNVHIHDAPNRTPLWARLRKSDESKILFTLRDPASSIPGTNLYAAPQP